MLNGIVAPWRPRRAQVRKNSIMPAVYYFHLSYA